MNTSQHSVPSRQAFSRLELLVVLFTLALLAAVALPVLAGTRPRADRITCLNNLRQIGKAFNSWASDHDDRNPWFVLLSEGGNVDYPLGSVRAEPWFQFSSISNELSSPKLLTDPADSISPHRIATSWDNNPNGGLLNAGYRNDAVSYFLNVHSFYEIPRSLFVGDRNLGHGPSPELCGFVGGYAWLLRPTDRWINSIHGEAGNLVRTDGQVEQLTNRDLPSALDVLQYDSGRNHLLFPVLALPPP